MDVNNFNTGLFIAITPSHILNFEQIIKNKLHLGNTILLNPGNYDYDHKIWDVVINGDMNLNYTVSSLWKKYLFQLKKFNGYKNYLKKIDSQISLEAIYKFYYCNLDDILTNHIFHVLKTNMDNTFYVVEDGILNYYNPNRVLSTLNFKKKLGKLYNFNFEVFSGHPTNVHSDFVKSQFVRLPDKAICPEKSVKLPFRPLSYIPDNNTILILGQDIMHNNIDGEAFYEARLDMLFKKVKERYTQNQRIGTLSY